MLLNYGREAVGSPVSRSHLMHGVGEELEELQQLISISERLVNSRYRS